MLSNKLCEQFLDGALTDRKAYLSGRFRGYDVVCYQINSASTQVISIAATSERDPAGYELNSFLNSLLPLYKQFKTAVADSHSLTLTFVVNSPKKFVPIANDIVNRVVLYLAQNNYITGCSSCGTLSDVGLYCVNGRYLWLCPDCAADLNRQLEENKIETKAQSSNLGAGIVGAVLGALAGAVLYVLIYQLGYIAGICGFVMAILAMKLYEKLGGCLDLKGVIASIVVVMVMVYFANKFAWTWDAHSALKEYGWSFADCFNELDYIIDTLEIRGDYNSDLVIGYLITVIGCVGSFIRAVKGTTGSFSFKQVEA